MEFFLLWLISSVIVGVVASKRGRSGIGYFVLSLIISPVLGLIVVLALKRQKAKITFKLQANETVCPKCKISYSKNEKFCTQCGGKLPEIHSSKYIYKLKKTKGDYGNGFVLIRVEDDQRLSWQTLSVGEGLISLEVAGTSHREKALQHKAFSPGNKLLLISEPENEFDEYAIGVWNSEKTIQVGYIPKGDSKRISDKLKKGQLWHAISMWETVKGGKRVGLRILMYREGTKILA